MTINIKASTIPEGTDANAVAGASAGEMHELTNKLHATVCFFFLSTPVAADTSKTFFSTLPFFLSPFFFCPFFSLFIYRNPGTR